MAYYTNYTYGVRIKVSEYARGAGTDLPRRRLTPAPCWVHPRDMCACTRPAAGWIAQRARSVPAPRELCAAAQQRRTTYARPGAAQTTCSCCSGDSSWQYGLRSIVSSIVMLGSASIMEFCGCTTPLYGPCGTAAELTASDPSLVQLASS